MLKSLKTSATALCALQLSTRTLRQKSLTLLMPEGERQLATATTTSADTQANGTADAHHENRGSAGDCDKHGDSVPG